MSDPPPSEPPDDTEAPGVEAAPGRPDSATERVQVLPGPPMRPSPPHHPFPWGWAAVGLILIAGGVLWLIQVSTDIEIPWRVALPTALIAVGLALVAGARSGRHSWLIAIGVILTISLIAVSSFDIKLEGGVGDRAFRPTTVAELQPEYHLAVGQLTIDLSGLRPPSIVRIRASVGIGELIIRVPGISEVGLTMHVGAGDVRVFGRSVSSGVDVDRSLVIAPHFIQGGYQLDLSVGLGDIQVTR